MEIIADRGSVSLRKEGIRELLRSEMVTEQLREARSDLLGSGYVSRLTRNVCRGAYIVSGTARDDCFEMLKKPIRMDNYVTRNERDHLLTVIENAKMRLLEIQMEMGTSIAERPPCLYDIAGSLHVAYRKVLKDAGAEVITLNYADEKPIEVCSFELEMRFVERMKETVKEQKMYADKVLKFVKHVQLREIVGGENHNLVSAGGDARSYP
jgi:hypothetical protein